MRRRWTSVPIFAACAIAISLAANAFAQTTGGACLPGVTCPSPTPTPEPPATETPPPTPAPSPELPQPTEPSVLSTLAPKPKPTPKPTSTLNPLGKANLPPGLDQNLNFQVPVIARTRPRNTANLVELLTPLTKQGYSLEQILVAGMGRFPVAGFAYYSDDWLMPRFAGGFHLHHGLDIFADFGTPIRAPDKGYVTSVSDDPLGGTAVWTHGSDGTAYYFAHMQARVQGIHVGMKVDIGTVIGFVGDTGDAKGGAPHLHFEIHPGGGGPVPPKPSVDHWLDEAERLAPGWVQLHTPNGQAGHVQLESDQAQAAMRASDFEATMLLTLLDPVGGSVGLLPRLELSQSRRAPFSAHVMDDLIKQRMDGYVLVPGASRGAQTAD